MGKMIDRVAEAICMVEEPDGLGSMEQYRDHARAAIEAMREPTEAMVDAIRETDCWRSSDRVTELQHDTWRNAIDAALKETN